MIKRVVALGFFDGLHIGHAELMKRTKSRAKELNATPAVMTFDAHPDTVVFGKNVPLINSASDREDIIKRKFGIYDIIFLHFNRELSRMPWREFIDTFVSELNIVGFVVGHDFTFGYKGEGNTEKLKEYCGEKGITLDIIRPVYLDGILVSSTHIRTLLEAGEMETASRFLGHNHFFSDTVHSGYRLGTQIGAPTINMMFEQNVIVPALGVYASVAEINGFKYHAVTNIGKRPTVSSGNDINIETHLLNFNGNLYGKMVRLEFYKHIRGEIRFASTAELSAQIAKDAISAEKYLDLTLSE